jgi:hypothetical protein
MSSPMSNHVILLVPMKLSTLGFIFCVFVLACLAQTASMTTQWGEKLNTAGARLVLKEIGRSRVGGQTVVSYRLYASGLPRDLDYTLWTRLPGSEPQGVADAHINDDGLVVNRLADPAHKIAEDPINIRAVAGRGEPKLFALISNDDMYRAFGEAIPFPIMNNEGSCDISVVMLAANYERVQVMVTGLQPNEDLQTGAASGGEGGRRIEKATAEGTYRAVVFPFVKGEHSGKTQFSVTAKSCKIGIEFPWGDGSYHVQ